MIEQLKGVEIPPDEMEVMRYVPLPTLLAMLSSRALYFNRADLNNDTLDGVLPRQNRNQIQNDEDLAWDEERGYWANLYRYGDVRYRHYVSCWHSDRSESQLMWDYYGSRGKGIVIRSTIGRIRATLETEEPLYIGSVKYISHDEDLIELSRGAELLFLKDTSWSHEHEVRIVAPEPRGTDLLVNLANIEISPNRYASGWACPADVQQLVTGITLHPDMPEWTRTAILRAVGALGYQFDLVKSSLPQSRS